jgi:MOSC domain-containing protein YiiM
MDLPWGAFGENLATQGLLEADVHVGDALRIGRARVRVTSPRLPCFKLGHRFGDPGMLRRFLASGRTGFYLQVVEEGDVGAGDAIEILERDPQAVSIADFVRLHRRDRDDAATLRRLLATPHLPDGWRRRFAARLEEIDA